MFNITQLEEEITPWQDLSEYLERIVIEKGESPKRAVKVKSKVISLCKSPKSSLPIIKERSLAVSPQKYSKEKNSMSFPKITKCNILLETKEREDSKIRLIMPRQHYKSLYRKHFIASRNIVNGDSRKIQNKLLCEKISDYHIQRVKRSSCPLDLYQVQHKVAEKYRSMKHSRSISPA